MLWIRLLASLLCSSWIAHALLPLGTRWLGGRSSPIVRSMHNSGLKMITRADIPTRGLADYEGRVSAEDYVFSLDDPSYRVSNGSVSLEPWQLLRFMVAASGPSKMVRDKQVIIKLKLEGDLMLQPVSSWNAYLGDDRTKCSIQSLHDLMMLFMTAAHDPQVDAIFVHLDSLKCGYAKLQEVKRFMRYFQKAGKPIIGYSVTAGEAEYFLASVFDEFYVPPCGSLELRGFAVRSAFYRDLLDKVGIEPHVQRFGKYKGAGDAYQRSEISEEGRETLSSLVSEVSTFWIESVASSRNISRKEVYDLWKDARNTQSLRDQGFLTAIAYEDDVEKSLRQRLARPVHKRLWTRPKRSSWMNLLYFLVMTTLPMKYSMPMTATARLFTQYAHALLHRGLHAAYGPVAGPLPISPANRSLDFNLSQHYADQPRRRLETSPGVFPLETVPPAAQEVREVVPVPIPVSSRAPAPTSLLAQLNTSFTQWATRWQHRLQRLASGRDLANISLPATVPATVYQHSPNTALLRLPIETRSFGERIGVIHAVGQIVSGHVSASSSGYLGAEDLIQLIRRAREDEDIVAVVLRVDSPGGSAVASDQVWKELRGLSRVKPVVTSMVDVAASGGYYFAMACDQIVAEDMTLTGSIGVVGMLPTAQELSRKVGYREETLSIGRFAELGKQFGRNYTESERGELERETLQLYTAFVEKAAAGRNKSFDEMNGLALGRVWTGRQALQRGLVDHVGGLWKALEVAARLANYADGRSLRMEAMQPWGWTSLLRRSPWREMVESQGKTALSLAAPADRVLAIGGEEVFSSGLVPAETLGLPPSMQAALAAVPWLEQWVRRVGKAWLS